MQGFDRGMPEGLLTRMIHFISDPDARAELGFDVQRCMALRIPPARLDLTRYRRLQKACRVRAEAFRTSVSWRLFHVIFYVPSTRLKVTLYHEMKRNRETVVFCFVVKTNVDINYETMIAASPEVRESEERTAEWTECLVTDRTSFRSFQGHPKFTCGRSDPGSYIDDVVED
jgi:hypothetical protein